MAKYVDGFVLVVPKGKEAEYEKNGKSGQGVVDEAWRTSVL